MYNVSKLVGIIKGINFGGTINEKEVVHLQSWVDKNRNLVYDSHQMELIKLVDKVLEESIITDDIWELLLLNSEKLLKETSDDNAKIYELNGIVEGIVCDGEVKEQEVYHLKAWMDINSDYIRGHKASEDLYKIINDILSDCAILAYKQEQLLEILSARISSTQFETKLEYLKKLIKARKNIGVELIDILDNEDAMDEIHCRAEGELKRTLSSYTGSFVSDPEVVFISLVLIAMLKYDGSFYDSVEAVYGSLYCRYPKQKIEGLIRTIISKYRTNTTMESSKSRIINTVLSNAIVPSHYLSAFFEFIYDIYQLNFEYTLADDLYEELRFVYEGLGTSMVSEGDDVQLNVTKKTYKLIKSTKQLIADKQQLDSIIKFSIIIVKIIDKKLWNKEFKIFNPYLKMGFMGWVENLKDDLTDYTRRRSKSEFRSLWEPKYILDNNKIYVVPPIHKVKSEYDYRDIRVILFNGEEEIFVKGALEIREIIGGYQVSIDKIRIINPLGYISYKLLAGNDVIYDSKEKLYRKMIVFDTTGSELHNNTNYSGTVVFCYVNDNEQVIPYYISEKYMLASQNVKEGDAFILEDTVYNFSSLIKPGIFGEKYQNHSVVDFVMQERMPVYKQVRYLVFESDNIPTRFEIIINGKIHKLIEYKYKISEREGVCKYVVDLVIDEPGVYSIVVYQAKHNKRSRMVSFNLALDPHLEVDELKLDDESYVVTIRTTLSSLAINAEIVVGEFSEDWLEIEYSGKLYQYHIPFDFDIYRISESSWKPLNQPLWIGNITQESILDIYGDKVNELKICANTGEALDEIIELKGRGIYQQVSIGFLMSYKASYDYIILTFMLNGVKKKEILCYNRCILDESLTEIVFDPVTKELYISVYYYGQSNVFFTICNSEEVQIYKSDYIESGNSVNVSNLKSFEKYYICFYEKGKGLFLKNERLLKQYENIFYAWDDFIGCSFRITKVYFDQIVKGEFLRKNYYFYRIYVTFLSKEGEDLYLGEIYVKTNRGNYMLDSINPVLIEICSEVLDRTMELAITKDGDGLYLDFEKHGIKNTLYDDSATDIFSYIIDMSGVE